MFAFDLNEDEETELIEKIAKMVVNTGLETPAIMVLEMSRPLTFVLSQLAVFALGPLLWLFDLEGPKYTAVFMKRGNVGKIIDRIDALTRETG
jgi:hypothetical protein